MNDQELAIGFPLSRPEDPVQGWDRPSVLAIDRRDES